MTDWRRHWKRAAGTALLLAVGVTAGARSADAATMGITADTDLAHAGQVDWGVLGPSFASVSNSFTTPVPGIGGLNITGSQAGGDFARIDQGSGEWNGNFGAGESLLWSVFGGPMTFTFNAAIMGFGTQIEADDLGAFTAQIEAFDATNALLGVFSRSGVATANGDDSAMFLGILSDTADIRSIRLSLTSSGGGLGDISDFAINGPSVEPVPEPTTMLLLGTGIATVVGRRYRKRA
jgi:PEP-CTERM motif